jgi:NADH:ubiquinone oxidoreductase subunit F (NADH-binding)/NADH:ubiquinone oxidoreductase subunit E
MASASSEVGHGSHIPGRETGDIVEDLRNAQEQKGYISPSEFEVIARRRGLHVKDVHTVASFFPHFRLKPLARADVRVCDDMTCHLHGARQLRESLELRFAGQTDVLVRDVSCVGRCDHPLVVSVNEHVHQEADLASTTGLILEELGTNAPEREPHLPRSFAERGLHLKTDPYPDEVSRYGALRKLIETRDYNWVLNTLKDGELRGMGGAGFPAYRKWEGARNAPGTEKFVVCNADESEPGTIKDRFILQHLPYLVFEGMIVCGLVVGAQRGYLYCRHEYEQQIEVLRTELARIYSLGLCGQNILGSGLSFELEVFVSPGGYICGEETALMEAIQGHRGEPRNKPPRTVSSGVWNKPTALNNVETFALASSILIHGPEWYKAQGRPGYPGLKFVGVTGGVMNPGAFEVPMGVSYRELIFDYAGGPPPGEEVVGFAPSGPSSGYLPASMLDTPLDWATLSKLGSMVGSGAVVVCTNRACMLDMAFNSVRFFRNESCGKCVPCRIGTQKMVEMLDAWMHGTTAAGDYSLLEELSHTLKQTSICGLGQIAPVPIQSVIKHFPEEVNDHIEKRRCRAGICFPTSGVRR